MGVYLPGENFATQGPAPSGFHVPLTTEWQAVHNVWTALGGGSSDGTNFGIALKLPFAGRRLYSSAGVDNQGASGFYRSSSRYNADNAYSLYFYSSAIYPQINSRRAFGFSVRCFKNSPVVPTSTWTKLYGTSIESGGIFWSSTDGFISLSSDGSNWLTIADKNLGATQVWSSGDTLSESNCGKYYQRGNNYGFAWTGSITTSSTQVNASAYGPGNYYSSSTFITRSSSPYDWSSVQNDNLWGGEDGNVPAMSELKNAYIGEYVEPGIFHNATLGLISLSSDGSTWLTISDKNLGATQVWNNGDALSQANAGKYYQWGNNYNFPFTGSVTTSSTKVDASNYGPGNYYSSSTFIISSNPYNPSRWDSTDNGNLRGGETGTNAAMQGPCTNGFHVPLNTEWQAVYDVWIALGGGSSDGTNFGIALKLPFAGYRGYSAADINNQGTDGNYWSSSRYSATSAYNLYFNSSALNPQNNYARAGGFSVRPFKNEAVQPDVNRTKLY